MIAPFSLDLDTALEPWDGRWFVTPPASGPRFLDIHQHTAAQMLRYGRRLNNWEAYVCQLVLTQNGRATDAQRSRLDMLASKIEGRRAA